MTYLHPAIRRTALLLGFFAAALSALGEHSLPAGFPAGVQLPAKANGEAAIAALAHRLPEVAAFYRKQPQELQALLRSDRCLWVDPQGQLYYVCEFLADTNAAASAAAVAAAIGPTDPPPFSTNETFLLHSRPGANRVIFLDFDGHKDTTGSWGTNAAEPPFDIDGDTNSFSSTERTRIVYIWQRVAEDYSMYDIDVTTEDPGVEALRKTSSGDQNYGIRVVIGGSSYDWYGKGVGGVAYVGSFNDNIDRPCWVFPAQLGPNSEKYIAEAASHEAGHTLGLIHDGTTTGSSYYSGQGNWAPIMGVGYNKPIVQWSKGEYTNANNTEDDLAVMLNYGAVYRADDHGNTTGTATVLVVNAGVSATNGVIERNTDLDFFRFTAGGGSVTITVARAPRDSNLRLQVILYDSVGAAIFTNTPADSSTSGTQSAVTTLALAAGNYYVSVAGTGNGNPLTTGYSDYASLGQYTLTVSGTVPAGSVWLPTAAGTYSWTNLPNWSVAPSNAAGGIVLINNNIAGNQTINLRVAVTLGTLTLGDANDTHTFNLQPAGGTLTFNNGSYAATLNKSSGLDDVIAVPVTLVSNLTVNHSAIGSLTLSGAIGGAVSLNKAGTGTTALAGTNSYLGSTTITEGVLRLDHTNALPSGNLTIDGGVLGLASGDFTNRTIGTGSSQVRWTGDGGFAAYGSPQAVRFSAGNLNWTTLIGGGNTLILGAEDSDATLIWQQAFSLAGSTRTIQVNDGPAAIEAKLTGAFGGGSSGTYTSHFNKTGGGTLALTIQPNYYGDTIISSGTLMLGDGTGNTGGVSQNSATILVSGGATLAVNRTGTLTQGENALPEIISGDGDFDQVGSGKTVFTLTNTYTGLTTISAGTLQLGNGTNANGVVAGDILNNAALVVANPFAQTYGGRISGSGTLTKTNAGTLTLTNTHTFTGVTTIGGGTLQLGDGVNSNGVVAGNILNNAALVMANPFALTYGGSISGGGTFTKTNAGTLTLTNTHTFSGGTTISDGILSVSGNAPALGSGTITFAGGDRLVIAAGLTLTNPIVVSSPGGVAGRGLLEPASGTVTISGPITLNSVLSGGGHFGYTSGTLILSGPITASVAAVQRNGTVIYSGGGTGYSSLVLGQGTAKVGTNDGMATSATVSIGASGAANLDLNGFNQSLAGVTKSANAATIGNSSTNTDATLTTTGTNIYDGTIQDVLGSGTRKINLTVGGGQLTLTGTNTYSGGTRVNAGTLLVNNSVGSGTGSGAVTINTNGTLGGTGSIAGVVTNNAGGTFAPGTNGGGTLTISGNLRLNAGSTNVFEVNGSTLAKDVVSLGAAVTYGGLLKIVPAGTFTNGQSFILFSGTGATNTGNFASFTGSPGSGKTFTFTNGVLRVLNAGPSGPARLTNSVTGNTLNLSWPAGEGWRLQMQTNSLSAGFGTNWFYVSDSTLFNTNIPIDSTRPTVFYRLIYP